MSMIRTWHMEVNEHRMLIGCKNCVRWVCVLRCNRWVTPTRMLNGFGGRLFNEVWEPSLYDEWCSAIVDRLLHRLIKSVFHYR